MGVYLEDVNSNYYEKIGLKENYGVLIKKVGKDTPAEKQGLTAKDVLMEIDGDKIFTQGQFKKMLTNFEPDQKVKLKYFRDGKIKNMKFVLGEKEIPQIKKKAYMGVYLAELKDVFKEQKGYDNNYGIVISEVVEDSPAEKSGIKNEAILMELNGDKIYTVDQLTKMMDNFEPGNHIEVLVFQDDQENKLDLILAEKAKISNSIFSGKNFDFSFEKPGNVFVYQYTADNDKWIGIALKVVKETKGDESEITVIIEEVIENSPAAQAGLQPGDLIIAFDGQKVDSQKMINAIIRKKEVGDLVDIEIKRDGSTLKLQLKIAERPQDKKMEKVELSFDDGEISVWMNGERKVLTDFDLLGDKLRNVEIFKQEEIEKAIEKTKHEMEKLRDLEELKHLKELEIHINQEGAI